MHKYARITLLMNSVLDTYAQQVLSKWDIILGKLSCGNQSMADRLMDGPKLILPFLLENHILKMNKGGNSYSCRTNSCVPKKQEMYKWLDSPKSICVVYVPLLIFTFNGLIIYI